MEYITTTVHEAFCPRCRNRHEVKLVEGVWRFVKHERRTFDGLRPCPGSDEPVHDAHMTLDLMKVRST